MNNKSYTSKIQQNSLEDLRLFESILNILEANFLLLDSEFRIFLINEKGEDQFGYNRNEIIGSDLFSYIPERFKKNISDRLKNIKQKESHRKIEIPILTKDGSEIIFSGQIKIINDESDNGMFYVFSGENITEKNREEKIKNVVLKILEASNSEKNLDDLFKFIHSSVIELMPADNFYIALYDHDSKMITFPYFIDKIDKEAPAKRFEKGLTEYVLKTGQSILINKENDERLRKSGEVELFGAPAEIWLGIPLKIQETTIGVMVLQDYFNENTYSVKEKEILEIISHPISRAIERKRVEQERDVLIKKLKDLNASKDKLFSLISHDLRSPFNSLLGFSEILTSEYDSLTTDEIKEYMNVIYETSKNLFGMTNNLLQFSRFQMGRSEFKPVKLNLKKIINENINMLKGNLLKKQLHLNLDIDGNPIVLADEEMLNSIFQNLLSNAIKFTDKEGEINISVKSINFFNEPDKVEVTINDTGIGISKSYLNKIFKDHVQSMPGTEREYGTGLGLLLVKEFVDKIGGTIKVSSKINQGTSFTFTIPIAS